MEVSEIYRTGVRMLFVQNVGQLPDKVVFYSMHPTTVYVLKDGTVHINGVKVSFGAKPRFITGDMPLKTKVSYFGRGKAINKVPTYKRIVLKEVYPKIDAILTAGGRGVVELQFIVQPGGDPDQIRVETDGDVKVEDDGIYVAKDGEALAKISDLKAYQGGEEVKVRPVLSGNALKFAVGEYDRRHTLVIDPVITAILTSSRYDDARAIAVDSSGIYIAGYTDNYPDFAPNNRLFGTSGYGEAFVSRLSPDLSEHLATAILGSDNEDRANAVAVYGGYVFVAGETYSSSTFAPSRTVFGTPGGWLDVFVSRLSLDLSYHFATAIITSRDDEGAYALFVDSSGVYVAGYTWDPTSFAPSRHIFGSTGLKDAFISRLDLMLFSHIGTAILASNSIDEAYAVAAYGGYVFVAGWTYQPSTFAPSRIVFGSEGSADAFVSKLASDLSEHIATALLTSDNWDEAHALAIYEGSVYVAGSAGNSSTFAPSREILGVSDGNDAFVSKLDLNLTQHRATVLLASNRWDRANSIAIDGGYVFVIGRTESSITFAPNRVFIGTVGSTDAFVSKLDTALSQHLGTVILASDSIDDAYAVAVNGDRVYVVGYTWNSPNFAADKEVFGSLGMADAFVSLLPISLNVSEAPSAGTGVPSAYLSDRRLVVVLRSPAYVGFDVYDVSGRLVKRVSLGYLPAGRYGFALGVGKGTYSVKVRIGTRVEMMKGVL